MNKQQQEFYDKMFNFIHKRCYKENRRWSANEIQTFASICVMMTFDYQNPEIIKMLENE